MRALTDFHWLHAHHTHLQRSKEHPCSLTTSDFIHRASARTNQGLASLTLEQLGGAQRKLVAACGYFTQAPGEDDPGRI